MYETFEEVAMGISRDDLDYSRLIGKHKEELASKVEELSEVKAAEKSAAKIEVLRSEITKKVRSEFTLEEGTRLFHSSPFISETVEINGVVFTGASFIAHKAKKDPAYDEKHLDLNPYNEHWQLEYKTRGPKFISSVKITGCLIVAASGPGICYAYLIMIKGRASPLIFFNGDLSDNRIISELQLEDTSLAPKYVAEAFRRSLLLCSAVYFYSPPMHDGWCLPPRGDRIFCSSEYDNLLFKRLYKEKGMRNVYNDIILYKSNRTFNEVAADYNRLLSDTLPVKVCTVISAMSRLLPQFQEEGLVQDRLWVVETSDDATAKDMTAGLQNRNHRSIEVLFSSKRILYIEEQIKRYVDCVMIIRHSSAIGSKYKLENIQELLSEFFANSYVDDSVNRMVPVLIIDNAGVLSEELSIHQLSLTERVQIENLEQVQKLLGELDYHIVKNAEKNPGAVKQRIKAVITAAKKMAATLPRRSQSNSAVMFLSTAILLKEGGILTEADIQAMLQWLCNEVKERTSLCRYNAQKMGDVASKAVITGRIDIGIEVGPPFWTPDKAMISSDGSFCLTEDLFSDEIYSNSDVPVGINKAKEDLKSTGDLLTYSNPKGKQKIWKVQTEDGSKKPRPFLTFSRDWLSQEANLVIDEKVASDKFHKLDEHIDNFFRFVKHERLDMYAGQVITDYKHGTPFIAVTGAPGSGKTDWMMQQVVQRVKTDDGVIVLDPTNAFLKEELLAHNIPEEIIAKHFEFWDLSTQGWPVNIMDFDDCKNTAQRVQKLSSLLISGLHLTGANQKFILVDKLAELLEKNHLSTISELAVLPAAFDKNDDEKKLAIKLRALFSMVNMHQDTVLSWGDRLSAKGKVLVISSGNAVANPLVNSFDILLDTLYAFKDKNRDGKMTVILDEVQTFNHGKKSTLVSILSRVRKLDISVILASQDYLNASLSEVYKYCGTHILFRPLGEECIKAVAKFTKLDEDVIRTLPDFHCAVMGDVYSTYYGTNVKLETAILGITYRPSYDIGSSTDEKVVNDHAVNYKVYVDVKAVRAATPATNDLKKSCFEKI
ncbi:ATP-binding protein [Ruminococcus flavefaciens]|uniref:AAA-like domain-containing protein n=1 Tax=Ruminococcus flavefaciens TaxID=1265 RepID=A0A1M7G9B2_RUMFL|nr:ATP-binding protein [Ruminococcus flavefaciens]SHM12870.1 AAA-like domain-containing protein [Ruminococcus flavefaciens]